MKTQAMYKVEGIKKTIQFDLFQHVNSKSVFSYKIIFGTPAQITVISIMETSPCENDLLNPALIQ